MSPAVVEGEVNEIDAENKVQELVRTDGRADGVTVTDMHVSMEQFTAEAEEFWNGKRSHRPNLPHGLVIGGRFAVLGLLGQGGYASVFNGVDQETNDVVAIKVQPNGDTSLANERHVYDKIACNLTGFKFPRMLFYGSHEAYDFLVVEKLGNSVFDRWAGKKMPAHEAANLGRQIIYQLEAMHSAGVVHCDVKAENMLYDVTYDNFARLIDFGVSQCFMDETGRLKEKQPVNALIGTWLFSPRSAHDAHTQCRRADLESLGYVLISQMGSKLPWEDYGDTPDHIWDIVGALKRGIDVGYLCRDVPYDMVVYMEYVRSLRFKHTPDYRFLHSVLESMSAQAQAESRESGSVGQGEM